MSVVDGIALPRREVISSQSTPPHYLVHQPNKNFELSFILFQLDVTVHLRIIHTTHYKIKLTIDEATLGVYHDIMPFKGKLGLDNVI
jgi:hypothetical protein